MKINYDTTEIHLSSVFLLVFIGFVFMLVPFLLYMSEDSVISFVGYWNWLAKGSALAAGLEWISSSLVLVIPVCCYIFSFIKYFSRLDHLHLYKSRLNIYSVEFLKDRVKFFFTNPHYNISCRYYDIKRIHLMLNVYCHSRKNGTYYSVDDVSLNFTLGDDRKFALNAVPRHILSFVYSLIDYTRQSQNFSYEFNNYDDPNNLSLYIDAYIERGKKDVLCVKDILKNIIMLIAFLFCSNIGFSIFQERPDDSIIYLVIVVIPVICFIFVFVKFIKRLISTYL